MSQEKIPRNTDLVAGGSHGLSVPRSKLISRGWEIAESLDKVALTIVRDIIVNIDKNGGFKRRAIIDAVSIKGEQLTEVSLGYMFNERDLPPERKEEYDIRIGDTVDTVTIGGFALLKVVKEKRTDNEKMFTPPDKCPACGSKIETPRPGSAYRCGGSACTGRQKELLLDFSYGIGISGVNPMLAKELVDKGIVWDPADLYFLKKEDLMKLDNMDEDSAQGLLDAIEKSRHPSLETLICALLITGEFSVGSSLMLSGRLASRCNSFAELGKRNFYEELTLNKWIPHNQANEIYSLFHDTWTVRFLNKLIDGGVIVPHKNTL